MGGLWSQLNSAGHTRSGGWMLMPIASAMALIVIQPTCACAFWVRDENRDLELSVAQNCNFNSIGFLPTIFCITELLLSFGHRQALKAALVLFSEETLRFASFVATVAVFEITAALTCKDLAWPEIGRPRKLHRATSSILQYPRGQPIERDAVLESLQLQRDGGSNPAIGGTDPARAAPNRAPPRTSANCASWAARHSPPAPPARPAGSPRRLC